MPKVSRVIFFVILAATSAGIAYGAKDTPNDAAAINNAKISLTQAIAAAEQHVHGKASRAEFEHSKNGWTFDVEVVVGAKVYDVTVDPDKGNVIAATEDKPDHDDDHYKRD